MQALKSNLTAYIQVSISIGRAAIFLIGGRSKSVDPVPILVRSGDIVIMSGTVHSYFQQRIIYWDLR